MSGIEGSIYYRMGYAVGEKVAVDCQSEVLKTYDSADMAILAGLKLNAIRLKSKTSLCNNETWGTGFWQGFMDWALKFSGIE